MDEVGALEVNTRKSVKCKAYSANPASSVAMIFFIDGSKPKDLQSDVTEIPSFDNGMAKMFVFWFTTYRSQNGKQAKCCLLWDGKSLGKEKATALNITCE